MFELAILFGFHAFNNEVEYEALIIGLQMALICGARCVATYSNSQLVIR